MVTVVILMWLLERQLCDVYGHIRQISLKLYRNTNVFECGVTRFHGDLVAKQQYFGFVVVDFQA